MKKLIGLGLTFGLALGAMAQGTIVFKPANSTCVIKYGYGCRSLTGQYAENGAYTVGLYYRAVGSTSFTLIATTPTTTLGILKGAYNGGTLGSPGITVPAATTIDLQLKVWNAGASSYETATTYSTLSAIFQYNTGDPANRIPPAAGLACGRIEFVMIPEPSTIALGMLFASLFFLRRRQ